MHAQQQQEGGAGSERMLPRKNARQPPTTLGKILGQRRNGRPGSAGGGTGVGAPGAGVLGALGPGAGAGFLQRGLAAGAGGVGKLVPSLEDCVRERDYAGALAILDFERETASKPAAAGGAAVVDGEELERRLWVGYCAFHAGEYEQAQEVYQGLIDEMERQQEEARGGRRRDAAAAAAAVIIPPEVHLYLACCLYYLQEYEQAERAAQRYDPGTTVAAGTAGAAAAAMGQQDGAAASAVVAAATAAPSGAEPQQEQRQHPPPPHSEAGAPTAGGEGGLEPLPPPGEILRNRLLFHIAHKLGNESKLLLYHQRLADTMEDQLSLAAIHFLRSHFQEATEIYKRLLLENRGELALNVYVAMCYYKMDYYDVALEILAVYLQAYPGSSVAVNLKACNHFRLYNGKAAEAELKALADQGINIQQNDLMRHNLVVFNGGQGALKVLPPLVDVIPEARLNLVIYYLKHDGIEEAFELLKDLEPSTPQEYVLKGVVHACIGQHLGSKEHLKIAQQLFQLVGASASECDTIPGRQCMASCFFLLKNFEDVNVYLNSIRAYLSHDDDFNWNYGLALAAAGDYKAAEEALLSIQSERYKAEYAYLAWLSRCCVMNGNPHYAWQLYLQTEAATAHLAGGSPAAFALLQLLANDCYRMGHFLYAAKAFEVLERLEPGDPEHWDGKRGACAGVFQLVLAGKLPKEDLHEVMAMLHDSSNNPQAEYMLRVMKKWCEEVGDL